MQADSRDGTHVRSRATPNLCPDIITRPGGTAHTEGRWKSVDLSEGLVPAVGIPPTDRHLGGMSRGPLAHSTHDVRPRHRASSQIEGAAVDPDHPPAGPTGRIVAMNRAPVDQKTSLDFWHRSVSVTQLKAMPFRGSR